MNSLMEEIAAEIDARAAVNEPRPSRSWPVCRFPRAIFVDVG